MCESGGRRNEAIGPSHDTRDGWDVKVDVKRQAAVDRSEVHACVLCAVAPFAATYDMCQILPLV